MTIQLPKHIVDAIAKSPRGVVPSGIKAVKETAKAVGDSVTGKKTYVSTRGSNYGNTYRKIGPVSVLKSASTPATVKQANVQRQAARVAQKKKSSF